jgi:hypothetical protein
VFFAGPADDAGFHRHHAAGLLADETGLLKASSGNFTTKEQSNKAGANHFVSWLLGCSTKNPEASCLTSGFEFFKERLTSFRQHARAGVNRVLAEQLLDAQELIVFRGAVGAAQRTGLDLAAVRRHGDVGGKY